jgi:nucleoside phosphorylase
MIIGIVDDDGEKRAEIAQIIRSVVGAGVDIREAVSIVSARRLLQGERLDLLILDIALPDLDDGEARSEGGVALLDEVMSSARYVVPAQVIGITAREDVYEDAAARFGSELWSVLRFDRTSNEWSERLATKLRHIMRLNHTSSAAAADYDIGIVVALRDPELEAVLSLPWSWAQTEQRGDPTVYHCGRFRRSDGTEGRAVVARAGQMGMPAATALATKLGLAFRPKLVTMVGICAGNKDDVAIGDLVAANPTWDYGSGKYGTREGKEVFEPAPYPLALSSRVRGILETLEGESEHLSALRRAFKGTPPDRVPRLHIGPFASGAAVVARAAMVEQVQLQHRKLLAIDMEAYGVATAASELPAPPREFLILKGVSDYADEDKGDSQRIYAAYLAAEMLALLCSQYRLC